MPLERLDGQTILPFGQALVPAKVSVQAGKGAASQISVTYGPHGSGSSASHILSQSLANRLRVKTDLLGSTLFRLTWKERVTPSGRRIPALRASGRRRNRLYFVADATDTRSLRSAHRRIHPEASRSRPRHVEPERFRTTGSMGDAGTSRLENREPSDVSGTRREQEGRTVTEAGQTSGFWRDCEWLWCRDEKYRPVEPGTFPLAHGAINRVGRLRGYGNALCAEQAKGFIEAYIEVAG